MIKQSFSSNVEHHLTIREGAAEMERPSSF